MKRKLAQSLVLLLGPPAPVKVSVAKCPIKVKSFSGLKALPKKPPPGRGGLGQKAAKLFRTIGPEEGQRIEAK